MDEKVTWQDDALRVTAGTQTGAILRSAFGRKERGHGPEFHGKASITSDGYIMCNFTARDGTHHPGAFVGSVDELRNNIQRLVQYLGLHPNEEQALFKAVREWIGLDYSGKGLGLPDREEA